MNERDLTVRQHTRRRESAPRKRDESSNAAASATLALRTTGKQHDAEKYARALCGVLRRWCDDCALAVAERMVVILKGERT